MIYTGTLVISLLLLPFCTSQEAIASIGAPEVGTVSSQTAVVLSAMTTPSTQTPHFARHSRASRSNAGLIAGITFLLLAIGLIAVIGFIFWRRRRNTRPKLEKMRLDLPPTNEKPVLIGSPDIMGGSEKRFEDEKDLSQFEGLEFPGTLPRVMLRVQPWHHPIARDPVPLHSITLKLPPDGQAKRKRSGSLFRSIRRGKRPGTKKDKDANEPPLPPSDNSTEALAADLGGQTASQGAPKANIPMIETAQLSEPVDPIQCHATPMPMSPNPIPMSPKSGRSTPQLGKLIIPSEKKRPVSGMSLNTPYTPYTAVVAFGTRQVLQVAAPQYWQSLGDLERGVGQAVPPVPPLPMSQTQK